MTRTSCAPCIAGAAAQDQVAWLGEGELETESAVEEVELFCPISEGLAERGVLESENLRDLQAIGCPLGGIDATSRADLRDNALATHPAWDEVRPRCSPPPNEVKA